MRTHVLTLVVAAALSTFALTAITPSAQAGVCFASLNLCVGAGHCTVNAGWCDGACTVNTATCDGDCTVNAGWCRSGASCVVNVFVC